MGRHSSVGSKETVDTERPEPGSGARDGWRLFGRSWNGDQVENSFFFVPSTDHLTNLLLLPLYKQRLGICKPFGTKVGEMGCSIWLNLQNNELDLII